MSLYYARLSKFAKRGLVIALWVVGWVVLPGGCLIVLSDEAVRAYRARTNHEGAYVQGYGLYERQIRSARVDELMKNKVPELPKAPRHGWELREFYRYKSQCERKQSSRAREWEEERKKLWKGRISYAPDSPRIYSSEELPREKYVCAEMKMFYRPGMGWGLF